MTKSKISFAGWLAKKYNVQIRDMKEMKFPRLWRKFTCVQAISIKGKYIYVRDLSWINSYNLTWHVVHEICHIRKQKKMRWSLYLLKYGLSKSFRRNREVAAFTWGMEWAYEIGQNISGKPLSYANTMRDSYCLKGKHREKALSDLEINRARIISGELTTVRDLHAEYERQG